MIDPKEFDDIRPYNDDEIPAAMERIVVNKSFPIFASYIYPDIPIEVLREKFRSLKTVCDFQQNVSNAAVLNIIKKSMTSFEPHGLQLLDKNKCYLFVSNHRDIVLDSALLQIYLNKEGFRTSEITFGSNLMTNPFVVDIGKSNKMYKVIRWMPTNEKHDIRQFYINSMHLSKYIRYSITEKHESSWIAQRNGRTKDGNDMTDQGLLKMFSMSGGKDLIASFAELNIVPISISYQWETCIVKKVNELFVNENDNYVKSAKEDLDSIISGILQQKGIVHLEVTPPITEQTLMLFGNLEKNNFIQALAQLINRQIYENYMLYNNNYIAYDLLYDGNIFSNKYTDEEKQQFITMMHHDLLHLDGDVDELSKIYLGIYANPVVNKLSYNNK